jgi:hypothetical protein
MSQEAFTAGLNYLYSARAFALHLDLIDLVYYPQQRQAVCTWIGNHIAKVNAELEQCLQACHACFHPQQRRSMQVLAAPFSATVAIDGWCNLQTQPLTILVDVGRVVPTDWIALVAHEYAHAHLGSPGHSTAFAAVLTHLCLGLGLELPSLPEIEAWSMLPAYCLTKDPLAFWRGQSITL